MRLPEGVSSTDFASAVAEFERAVGKSWVFTSDADVDLYRDAFSPFLHEPEELVASAAVAPASTEEVQSIVRTANRYKIPLYPISTGKNLGYGGSAPAFSGSVVVDLKRMNRIIEVNEANACALVEPGVSYFDLYRQFKKALAPSGMDRLSRPGLGQPGRKRPGSWWRLYPPVFPQSLRLPLRHGSGAAQRRIDPHRHRGHSQRQDLAAIQVGLRAVD